MQVAINRNINFQNTNYKSSKKEKCQNNSNTMTNEICSKNAASAIKANILAFRGENNVLSNEDIRLHSMRYRLQESNGIATLSFFESSDTKKAEMTYKVLPPKKEVPKNLPFNIVDTEDKKEQEKPSILSVTTFDDRGTPTKTLEQISDKKYRLKEFNNDDSYKITEGVCNSAYNGTRLDLLKNGVFYSLENGSVSYDERRHVQINAGDSIVIASIAKAGDNYTLNEANYYPLGTDIPSKTLKAVKNNDSIMYELKETMDNGSIVSRIGEVDKAKLKAAHEDKTNLDKDFFTLVQGSVQKVEIKDKDAKQTLLIEKEGDNRLKYKTPYLSFESGYIENFEEQGPLTFGNFEYHNGDTFAVFDPKSPANCQFKGMKGKDLKEQIETSLKFAESSGMDVPKKAFEYTLNELDRRKYNINSTQ